MSLVNRVALIFKKEEYSDIKLTQSDTLWILGKISLSYISLGHVIGLFFKVSWYHFSKEKPLMGSSETN